MDALLYYARAVNNRLLVGISAIGTQQVAATEQTVAAIDQLLDHVATYPDYEIIYRASDMILAAHSDTGLNNDSKARSRAGADIFLSEDEPTPKRNGAVLAIAQIMKLAMSLVAEVELGALYITAKETVPVRQTLIEMGWKQPQSPIQTDNSTLTGVVNKTIIQQKRKSMDLRVHWLRCRESQGQFRFYWAPGHLNWRDYSTKHHTPIYHTTHQPLFPGYANIFKR